MQQNLWKHQSHLEELRDVFQSLINNTLPSAFQSPVCFNHCFNRIILDWLFEDAWYNHLNKKKTAVSQLHEEHLQAAITRMKQWLIQSELLEEDNRKSLRYRKKIK